MGCGAIWMEGSEFAILEGKEWERSQARQPDIVRQSASEEYPLMRLLSASPSRFIPPQPSWEERLYPSPDGQLTAVFKQPWELQMGALVWEFDLQVQGSSILVDHPYLASSQAIRKVRCPADLAPWSPIDSVLGLLTWEGFGAFLYSVPAKRVRELAVSAPPVVSLKWSRRSPHVAVVHRDHCLVFDSDGARISNASWSQHARSSPFVFWWPDSEVLLALVDPPDERPPHLIAFSAETGAIQTEIVIDPAEILPYDEEAFANLPRDSYSLQVSPGRHAVGRLLDIWHRPFFDPDNLSLTLAVYRPSLEHPTQSQGSRQAVEEVWATVKLAA
jgi:hypothetical protein